MNDINAEKNAIFKIVNVDLFVHKYTSRKVIINPVENQVPKKHTSNRNLLQKNTCHK